MHKLLACLILAIIAQCCPQEAVMILDEVNVSREKRGLTRLLLDEKLTREAISRLPEVMENFSHEGFGKYIDDAVRGECLCKTPEESAVETCMWWWQQSARHWNVIMMPRWTKAGIVAAIGDDGWTYFVLWLE